MTALIFIVPVLTAVLLLANALLAPQKPDYEKSSTYECGYDTLRGQTRSPFTIAYYLVGVLFLAFDCEITLLYPFVPSMGHIGVYGFTVLLIFFIILTLGFVVEIAAGVLSFTDQRSAIRETRL